MKGIKLPKSIPSMRALIQRDLKMREELISVLSIWGDEDKKPNFDRNKVRAGHPIPNIQDFVINIMPYDGLTSLFGIRKRNAAKKTFYTGFNDDANLFIDFKFDSIRKAVENKKYKEALETIGVLMNSAAYQVSATNHVLKNGHRKLTYKEIIIISKQVDKLVKQRATKINFARVYIPKGDKYRPLGVPTPAGRIYLHMYNNCLVEGRSVTETGKQHGYLPNKGIITAWQAITSKLNQPNIYEADFKGFFDNVEHSGLHEVLAYELNLPESEAIFIRKLNQSLVKLQEKDKVVEEDRKVPLDSSGGLNPDSLFNDTDEDKMLDALMNWGFPMPSDNIEDMGNLSGMLMNQSLQKDKGVPQGAPTSCSLATLALRFIEYKRDVVIYADDVIFFPNKLESEHDPAGVLEDSSMGIRCNREKSRWIKKEGVGLVDSFKFLGIRYYPPKKFNLKYILENGNPQGGGYLLVSITLSVDQLNMMPIFTIGAIILELYRIYDTSLERFAADTRNGAKLEFKSPHSFLSGLSVARQLMLDSTYFKKGALDMSLVEWIQEQYSKGSNIKTPLRLLFMKPFKNKSILTQIEDIKKQIGTESPEGRIYRQAFMKEMLKDYQKGPERYTDIEKSIQRGIWETSQPSDPRKINKLLETIARLEKKLGVKNPLTGYFVSRMQSNTWDLEQTQNFSLKYIAGSGCEQEGIRYSREGILPKSRLNVFVASTFANHDLMEWLSDYKSRSRKPRIRRVLTTPRTSGFSKYIKLVIHRKELTGESMVF